jgi:hypothetical protein
MVTKVSVMTDIMMFSEGVSFLQLDIPVETQTTRFNWKGNYEFM